jgi:hypothetical protein
VPGRNEVSTSQNTGNANKMQTAIAASAKNTALPRGASAEKKPRASPAAEDACAAANLALGGAESTLT